MFRLSVKPPDAGKGQVSEEKLQPNSMSVTGTSFPGPPNLHERGNGHTNPGERNLAAHQRRDGYQSFSEHADATATDILNLAPDGGSALAPRYPRSESPSLQLHRA